MPSTDICASEASYATGRPSLLRSIAPCPATPSDGGRIDDDDGQAVARNWFVTAIDSFSGVSVVAPFVTGVLLVSSAHCAAVSVQRSVVPPTNCGATCDDPTTFASEVIEASRPPAAEAAPARGRYPKDESRAGVGLSLPLFPITSDCRRKPRLVASVSVVC